MTKKHIRLDVNVVEEDDFVYVFHQEKTVVFKKCFGNLHRQKELYRKEDVPQKAQKRVVRVEVETNSYGEEEINWHKAVL